MHAEQSHPSSASLVGYHVLIVEDDYFVAQDLCELLREHGATVHGPAPNVRRGRELSRLPGLDCALLDVNLHGEFVFDLARELRQQGVRTILTTGYDASFLVDQLQSASYLQKPVDMAVLVEMIRAVPPILSSTSDKPRAHDLHG
jgi:DNA-binding response OmpR family regulator